MSITENRSAVELRDVFKAIPDDRRHANQAFSIRVWRGISWLERSEADFDLEGRFISLWITFNSIYGYLEAAAALRIVAVDKGSWRISSSWTPTTIWGTS